MGQKPRRVLTRRLALRWSEVALPSTVLLRAARDAWRLPEARLHYIPNGLDIARFRPDGPRSDLAPPGEGPVIGTVAALRAEKNLARLLRAAALLRDQGIAFRLVVIGDGPVLGRLRELAERFAAVRPNAKVLYMSGNAEDGAAEPGAPAIPGCFLQKPFTPEALTRRVRAILEQ